MNDYDPKPFTSLSAALNCDPDCSWRVLRAVKTLIQVAGMTIDQVLEAAEMIE